MKRLPRYIAHTLFVLAGIYWVGVNLALSLPHTRDALNEIQPEQFQVDWRHAWSLYPLRIEFLGLAADGQTPVEQWQLDADRAAVSVSLLPLLRGEIRVHDLDLEHIDLRLRPRPSADGPDHAGHALTAFYPVIRNRDPSAVAEPAPPPSDGRLVLEVDDIHIRGEHAFWVSHIRGWLPGQIRGSFQMDTETSEVSLSDGMLDLSLKSLRIADRTPVTEAAALKGEIEIPPFRLSETEGLEFLRVANLDAELDLPVDNLDFLGLVIPGFEPLELSGSGQLSGRARLAAGEVLGGTDLVVAANALAMTLGQFRFSGDGLLEMRVDPANEAEADLTVRFDRVVAEAKADTGKDGEPNPTLFDGHGLTARLHVSETDPGTTSTATEIQELANEVELGFSLEVPGMRVEDLSVYNRLIPDAWDLTLLGGTGTVQVLFEVTSEALSLELDLASDEAALRYADYHATTDLQLQLRARVDDAEGPTLHLQGTRLQVTDARVDDADADKAGAWQAALVVNGGTLALPAPETDAGADPIPLIAREIAEDGFGSVLTRAHGELETVLTVSELDWVADLLNRPLGLSLDGAAEIDAALHLRDGLLGSGSRFEMPREPLSLALLEHRIDGRGEASLLVERGGRTPSVKLRVDLRDGRIRRRQEPEPSIGGAHLEAVISVAEVGAKTAEGARVELALHSAEVRDMAVYNAYLPKDAPVSLAGGTAKLVGDMKLTDSSAGGQVLLTTDDIEIVLDEETVTGDLQAEVLIRDGAPNEMRFDITGSSLRFDEFRVHGQAASDDRTHWHARLQLEETEVVWDKPMQLHMNADITVQDTRPFVAMLDNLRGKPSWIDKLLTARDLAGHLRLRIDGDRALIEDAMVSSAKIGVHAKGLAGAGSREGLLLLRWHNLSGAVAIKDGEKQFRLAHAPRDFEAYQPGRTTLASGAAASAEDIAAAEPSQPARERVSTEHHRKPQHHRKPPAPSNPFLNEDL
jgi:hypothetical protein